MAILPLKNYLSKGGYFIANGAVFRGKEFKEEIVRWSPKNYAMVLCRHSLRMRNTIMHCDPSSQKVLAQTKHFLSSSPGLTVVVPHKVPRLYTDIL